MKLTRNARTVLEKRYLRRDETGKPIETAEDLFCRVSKAVAAGEQAFEAAGDVNALARRFYRMMADLRFLPNSPTLMNAGRPLGQLSACFVLPVEDSMEDIFTAVKNAALIHKSGGGTGFSFSRLRPKGAPVHSTGGVASGPISFMKVFNAATEAVKQGGVRKGANMGILRVDHPDIMEFITCKNRPGELNNFNLSVGVTEPFMEAARKREPYPLVDPSANMETSSLPANEVFDAIVDSAFRTGEPGILFLDRLNRDNPVPGMGEIETTNPCGEQPLLPYESCNLGSVNLAAHVRPASGGYVFDWEKLTDTVCTAVHFLDNVIEINRYPLPEIQRITKMTRKIGLGVMGFADTLLCLGIPYNSEEGILFAEKLMSFIRHAGREESRRLAKLRGPFPLFAESIYRGQPPLRNATITTIAPTGTLSILAGVSSGVEPVFAYAYVRNVLDNTPLPEGNELLKERLKKEKLCSGALMEQIASSGSLAQVEGIPPEIRRVFVCAHDISPAFHVNMQAAFQRHTDNAVSKTVSFPSTATREEIAQAFYLAWTSGCKGITVYRDGSRSGQVLQTGGEAGMARAEPPSCPDCFWSLREDASPQGSVRSAAKYCPECGSRLTRQGTCACCPNCGYSECGCI
ncbi:MAG: adenosylcobalamin-dependent ribonucleoside-diphosphate reductase [Oscillospiraceae bacterium]|nr:adenosylcobalamin-dependent ribonucleoside-diphosphate reductase [Oscillospiraceae bacterium]